MSNILILSFCNIFDNPGYYNYKKLLNKFGYNYKILGKGIKWEGFVKTKIQHCYDYLMSDLEDLKGNLIICITDVLDFIPLQSPTILYKQFLSFNTGLVIGAEEGQGLWACYQPQKKLYPKKQRRKCVNGGFYMGYKKNICKLLEFIINQNISDDQICLGKYHYLNFSKIDIVKLDINCKLIYNICIGNNLIKYSNNTNLQSILTKKNQTQNLNLIMKNTNELPCFLHGPGSTCKELNKIIIKLFPNIKLKKYTNEHKILNHWGKKILKFLFPFICLVFLIYELIIPVNNLENYKKINTYLFFTFWVILSIIIILFLNISPIIIKNNTKCTKKVNIYTVWVIIIISFFTIFIYKKLNFNHLTQNILLLPVSGLSIYHFIFFTILAYYFPTYINTIFFYSTIIEIIQIKYNISKIKSNYYSFSNILFNYLGILFGLKIYKIFNIHI
jgi:hypothetical protein